jgi:SAM-dependent methyltransferase
MTCMPSDSHPPDLSEIAARTLGHYDDNAARFWEGTRDHDVTQNYQALLGALGNGAALRLLDFGCGPGRDLVALRALGQCVTGLDGSAEFVRMARAHSGCEVLEQSFFELDLGQARFDGVFANASLFHVPSRALPEVLGKLHACLKPGGVLFSSNPRGNNQDGWTGGRYGVYHDLETWRRYVTAAGFVELGHYYRPAGLPRDQQPWLASVWRKPAHASNR